MMAQRAERLKGAPLAVLLRSDSSKDDEDQRSRDIQERTDQRASEERQNQDGFGSTFQTILRITPRIVVEGIGEVQAEGSSAVIHFSSIRRKENVPTCAKTIHGNVSGFGTAESVEDNITR